MTSMHISTSRIVWVCIGIYICSLAVA